MSLTNNRSLSWVMLAFADWTSTGTHYQVHNFSDVALPELHGNSITAISFTTYILWNAVWVFECQKSYSSTVKAVQNKSANTGHEQCVYNNALVIKHHLFDLNFDRKLSKNIPFQETDCRFAMFLEEHCLHPCVN